jgi:hypothetical protein
MKRWFVLVSSVIYTILLINTACQPSVSYIFETIPPVTVPETRVLFNTSTQTVTSTTNVTTTTTITSPTTLTTTITKTTTNTSYITNFPTTTTTTPITTTTVQAKTLVSGVLPLNTTWNSANSPYALTGNVQVPKGGTLIIQAGVEVDLRDKFIQVDGTLQVLGTIGEPVNIRSSKGYIAFTENSIAWNNSNQTGSIIQNAIILGGGPQGLVRIQVSSPKITNCTIKNIEGLAIGIENASPIVVSNSISASGGIYLYNCAGASIINNIFTGYSQAIDLVCYLDSCNVVIEHNLFDGRGNSSNIAIQIWPFARDGHHIDIISNTITGNTIGIGIRENGGLVINKFTGSIGGNAFVNNNTNVSFNPEQSNIQLGINDINMANNWWGTTDIATIESKIYDYYDDFRLGKVIYAPFLTSMPTDVPVLPP